MCKYNFGLTFYTNLIIFFSVGHLSYPKQGETPLEGQDEEFGDDQSINHDKKHNNPFVRYVYIWRFLQINAWSMSTYIGNSLLFIKLNKPLFSKNYSM